MKQTTRSRRAVVAATAMIGLSAFLAPPAQSAEHAVPNIINGKAYAQALEVIVNIPSAAELQAALVEAGYPVGALPGLDLGRTTQTLVIASNHGEMTKTGDEGFSKGWAAPLLGSQSRPKSETRCATATCVDNASVLASQVKLPAPLDLGTIDIAGALSKSEGIFKTRNRTGAVDVGLNLGKLIGEGAVLAPIGAALETARTTINGPVRTQANSAIDKIVSTLDSLKPLDPIRDELDHYVTLGHLDPIPDLRTVDLLRTTVLSGNASLADQSAGDRLGVEAVGLTKIVDLSVFGGLVSADSISVKAEAFANGKKGLARAAATPDADVLNVNLAGLLKVHLSSADLDRILNPETLKTPTRDTLKQLGLTAAVESIENAIDLSYNIAGVSVEHLESASSAGPSGTVASAEANSFRLRIAPTLPKLAALTRGGAGIPKLAKSDFVPTGLSITIELPRATAAVASPTAFGVCIESCTPITGVENKAIFGMLLLGLALGVRRFAFSR